MHPNHNKHTVDDVKRKCERQVWYSSGSDIINDLCCGSSGVVVVRATTREVRSKERRSGNLGGEGIAWRYNVSEVFSKTS